MSAYKLLGDCYILPTPAGAYYAVSNKSEEIGRWFLLRLLSYSESQQLTTDLLLELSKLKSEEEALEMLYRVQGLSWVHGEEESRASPEGKLEEALPSILGQLSSTQNVLLVDNQGLFLSSHGFSYELAEELAALSADLSSLYERHEGLLRNNMSINTSAWGLINSNGDGQLGIWPLYIGESRFSLVLTGAPQFNQQAFVDLIWLLSKRYLDMSE